MNRLLLALFSMAALCLFAHAAPPAARTARTARVRMRMDEDWRFRRDPKPSAHQQLSWQWRAATVPSLNVAHLPTDLEEGDWYNTTPGEDVFHNRLGFAWYRTTIPALAAKGTGPLTLHFEGIDDNAAIYLNGVRLTEHF